MSVYVDDIIFSSNDKDTLLAVYNEMLLAIRRAGFIASEDKSHSPREKTCAFNIDMELSTLKISEQRYAEFAENVSPDTLSRAEAIIGYVSTICPAQAAELSQLLETRGLDFPQ